MKSDYSICFILPNGFDLGGVTSWSAALAGRLAERGRQAVLVSHLYGSGTAAVSLSPDVAVIKCNHGVHPNYRCLRKKDVEHYSRSYLQALPSVFVPNYSFGSYAACACLAARSPDTIRVIGMAHTDSDQYYRWLVRFEPIIHTFIAVSSEIADNLAGLLPHRREDIVMRPCGVDVYEQCSIRTYSPPSRPLQLVYAGRLTERQKRVSDLVRLAVQLERRKVDFEFHIYGDGRDRRFLESLIRRRHEDVRRRMKIEGYVQPQSMRRLYRQSDILVLVSEYEGTSLSMLEAMAEGCVPVVSRVSGAGAVIESGRNGFTVPVGAVAEMAEKIAWLERDRERLGELGSLAQATIDERYSYRRYVPWFASITEQTWRKTPRPGTWKQAPYLYIPVKEVIREACYTLASKRGLRWLHHLRDPARKFLY